MKLHTKIILNIGFLGISSCATNNKIIQETKKCHDAGLDTFQSDAGYIMCVPRPLPPPKDTKF